ncbi:hypothetical protein [Helicobacter sp. UBA3407]|nr:hypothetical protein [Helicobacter sp. UBA3407]
MRFHRKHFGKTLDSGLPRIASDSCNDRVCVKIKIILRRCNGNGI